MCVYLLHDLYKIKCDLNSPAKIKIKSSILNLERLNKSDTLIHYLKDFFFLRFLSGYCRSLKLKQLDNVLNVRVYVCACECVCVCVCLRSSGSVSSGRPRGQKRSRLIRCLKTARPVCACSSLCASGLS